MDLVSRAARRRPTLSAHVWTPSSLVTFQVFLHGAVWILLLLTVGAGPSIGMLVEVCSFFAVTAVFVAAHLWGRAGAGAGAGLRLAAVALTGRIACGTYLSTWGFTSVGSLYDDWPGLAPWVWFVRNVGLAIFAYGLALTLFAVLVDAVRRRCHPAWVPSLED